MFILLSFVLRILDATRKRINFFLLKLFFCGISSTTIRCGGPGGPEKKNKREKKKSTLDKKDKKQQKKMC